jgi:hypothetical protein
MERTANRVRIARIVRRAYIVFWMAAYWLLAAFLIADAYRATDVFAWTVAIPYTAPVSLLSLVIEVNEDIRQRWCALFCCAGAVPNGLAVGWLAGRLVPNPPSPQR